MSVSEKIKSARIQEEFRVCPVCGHDMGFNTSIIQASGKPARVILICPECGARFDLGWEIDLAQS
jgi:transcription elongation factor Elf1